MISDAVLRLTRLAARVVIWPVVTASLLALLAASWWLADLAVHFRVQYALIGLLGVPIALALRDRSLAGAAALALALNIMPVAAYLRSDGITFGSAEATAAQMPAASAVTATSAVAATSTTRSESSPASTVSLRVASLNVFFENTHYDAVARWIEQSNADIVALLEADQSWVDAMALRRPEYAHHWLSIVDGRSGKLLLSRLPFTARETIESHSIRAPSPLVTLNVDGVHLQLTAVHTVWPMGADGQDSRNRELAQLAKTAAAASLPFVAMGDYNVSPFSPYFETLLHDSGLHRAAAGRGWLPTWPSFLPFAGIQIDHLLVSDGIAVESLQTAPGPGSDHRALVGALRIRR